MKTSFDALEWQQFALKKDVEQIVYKMNAVKRIGFSLFIEIFLVVLSVALSSLVQNNRSIWIGTICVCCILVIGVLVYEYCIWRKENRSSVLQKKSDYFIDRFDNEICYYAMTSQAFADMVLGKYTKEEEFYFIEACYYFNKSIHTLAPILLKKNELLTLDIKDAEDKRKILTPRVIHLCEMLNCVYNRLMLFRSNAEMSLIFETIKSNSEALKRYLEILKNKDNDNEE